MTLMCLHKSPYHVSLELLVCLGFQEIMLLLLFVLLLDIHTLFFFLTFSFFIFLNVSFIVSFFSKLSFMFPLALLIVILLSIFWYSWIGYFLCIYFFYLDILVILLLGLLDQSLGFGFL